MNSQQQGSGPQGASASLPELGSQRIDEIENALFADIARERVMHKGRSARRGRLWLAGGAAAAVIVVAAVIAPSVGSLVSGGAGDESALSPAEQPAGIVEPGVIQDSSGSREAAPRTLEGGAADQAVGSDSATTGRDIITTASASVTVGDVEVAARSIGNSAVAHGGYVESMSVGTDGTVYPIDPMTGGGVYDTSVPYPYTPDGAWVTVRVPADQLAGLVEELSDVGDVTATSINRQDVTEQTVDLAARVDATQASVDRLTELMGQAQSVADLLTAESALSERQAMLESYQQQLEMLEGQVAMSTLSVTITPEVEPVTADPAGFGDGLAAGWNGLVATLNGIVVALGFLLPWLMVVAIAGLVVWAIVRLVRSRRQRRADDAARSRTGRDESES